MSPSVIVAFAALSTLTVLGRAETLITAPMGFNNWARFECALNQSLFTDTADAMVSKGLLKAGYNRLNLDDCWLLHNRTDAGKLQWDPEKFPDGLVWLGNYLHNKGFHFGIYQDAGTETCGGYPGSLGYEEIDAETFASWGVDYLKLDGCNVPQEDGLTLEETYKEIYGHWHDVLSNMTDPLIFSESAPAYFCGESNLHDWYTVMDWVPSYGDLARHSYDVATYPGGDTWHSIMSNYGQQVRLARYQKVGYYNDPDFIIPDWPDLNIHEKMSHFGLWASFSAPLIISAYIPGLSDEEINYLTNSEVILVDQDALGLQATLVSRDGTWDVLTKSLANGDRLLTVLNVANTTGSVSIPMQRLGVRSGNGTSYNVKNLWTGETSQTTFEISLENIPGHATALLRVSEENGGSVNVTPTGQIFNTASLACIQGSSHAHVTNATCNAADSQVWQIDERGSIRSLASESECLTGNANGSITMTACKDGNQGQHWIYYLNGNVVNKGFGKCLTETMGDVKLLECEDEANSQVFGLPSGVTVL